ncbi:SNF2 family DNA-dependent ATPase [Punctularia strigosozonata HHB-11173 SS5]|uniref:SNF2 family DNA-dependent ATPase n=1 Tax=Punctularia strigosozonata (strain HHB-11173) TaxID=741275 RepID=UPI0004416DC8|nr:SNF2 family DNA-dependent ATPase [Punctularia strigosozonata HHB-11173 SS5]EIN11311.1 SNF2 family DNA-dependent ATPase [Punctularia strigosozonata HHB-11173 SS5]
MKKTRKVVVESESEAEASDAEDIRTSPPVGGSNEDRVFAYLNTAATDAIQELTGEFQDLISSKNPGESSIPGCTMEQAAKIIELRPFTSVDDLKEKLGQGKKKAGPAGISSRMFEDCTAIFEGYRAVDDILRDCEKIGAQLRAAIASWSHPRPSTKGKERDGTSSQETSIVSPLNDADDGALHILKDYQLAGLNWLRLLYRKGLSCILADEMGLGKTIQVISFFAHLKERGNKGPHLVVVPSSTLENWCREFARFAPDMVIQTYYAGKDERPMLRETLKETQACKGVENGWEVLITTYNLAQGDDKDRKFFKRIEWDSCVFDEGHVLKNFQSQRYQALLKYESKWRLLLTGTPLQNNLQELVSLMNFILPEHFAEALGSLRAIFKVKGDSKVSLLAQERVSRAKKMMTPFVLRRRKDQVLKDLPKKVERIEWCDMSAIQKSIYRETLQRSRKTIFDAAENDENQAEPESDKMYIENSSNVLMDLRKAALHPMLFRKLFTDDTLASMTRLLMKEPDYKKRKAVSQYVREDLEVMTDAELQLFCKGYKSLQKFVQDDKCYLDAGKITVLLKLIRQYIAQSRRILVFSQFTQVLDILETILRQQDVKFVTLTGSTPVDARQALVDDFTEDESIPVFLLSTRAGGMGINLTAASVVVMYDQDFNPHNDRQAQDRAYRIGQKQDVDVVKLVTRGTIEEDMLRLGETKLALDEAVAGEVVEGEGKGEGQAEKQMKESLMSVLRKQFESEESERDGQPELSTKESSTKEADARSASPLTDMED